MKQCVLGKIRAIPLQHLSLVLNYACGMSAGCSLIGITCFIYYLCICLYITVYVMGGIVKLI